MARMGAVVLVGETTIGMHRHRPIRYYSEDGGRREAVGARRKICSRVVFVPHYSDSLESGRNSGRPALGSDCNVSRFHTNRGLCLLSA